MSLFNLHFPYAAFCLGCSMVSSASTREFMEACPFIRVNFSSASNKPAATHLSL